MEICQQVLSFFLAQTHAHRPSFQSQTRVNGCSSSASGVVMGSAFQLNSFTFLQRPYFQRDDLVSLKIDDAKYEHDIVDLGPGGSHFPDCGLLLCGAMHDPGQDVSLQVKSVIMSLPRSC